MAVGMRGVSDISASACVGADADKDDAADEDAGAGADKCLK